MEKIYDYTIKLLRYVLKGDVPDLPNDIDFEKLYEFGRSHGVENMLYVGLKDLKIDVPKDVFQKFYYSYLMSIKIDTLQTMELEKIGKAFEEAGIDYIPLKGSVVKYFYPMTNYRKSGDIDVLVRGNKLESARAVVENEGYKFNYIYENHGVHYEFTKNTFFHLELHRKLVSDDDRSGVFLSKAWDYAKLKSGTSHTYEFDINFLYVHLIAHIAKHLCSGGAGLRLFCDIWIMQNKNMIDKTKVRQYLEKANLSEIEKYTVKLVERWFLDKKENDKVLNKLELFVFRGGSFGTVSQKLNMASFGQTDSKQFKNKYWKKKFLSYFFEPLPYMKQKYPILISHSWLLPIMWVYRLVTIPFTEMHMVSKHFKEYSVSKKSDMEDLSEIYKIVK